MQTVYSKSATLPGFATEAVLEEHLQGRVRLIWHGRLLIGRLSPGARALYERAKREHFSLDVNTTRNPFFFWCEIHNEPYIVIRKTCKYASVEMDLITTTFDLSQAGVEKVQELWISYPHRSGGYSFFGSVFNVVRNIPVAAAETVGKALYGIFQDYAVERPSYRERNG